MSTIQSAPRSGAPAWRPLAWCCGILLLLEALGRLAVPLWQDYQLDDYRARIDGATGAPRDLLLIGGSPVSEGLQPEIFQGMTAGPSVGPPILAPWSLGLPGGTWTDSYMAFRQAVAVHGPPRVAIVGLLVTDSNDARNEPHGAYSIYRTGDVLDIVQTRPDAAEWTVRRWGEGQARQLSVWFRDRYAIRSAVMDQANRWQPDLAPQSAAVARRDYAIAQTLKVSSGYAPAPWFAEANYAARKARGESFPPFGFLDRYRFGSHARYLERLILEYPQTRFVLVRMPTTNDFQTRFSAEWDFFEQQLSAWEASRGWPILRVDRDLLGLSDADFGDWVHLNRAGAEKVSRWVRGQLETRPELWPAKPVVPAAEAR